jgi:hypothetical protein
MLDLLAAAQAAQAEANSSGALRYKGCDISQSLEAILRRSVHSLLRSIDTPSDYGSALADRSTSVTFPLLAAAFETARGPTLTRKRKLDGMSQDQRAALKHALHEDIKRHIARVHEEVNLTPKTFGPDTPLPANALECRAALDQLIADTERQIRALEERVDTIESAKSILAPTVADAEALTAYNAVIDQHTTRFTSLPPPTPKDLSRTAGNTHQEK